jgi:hypothetical protein
MKRSGLVLWMAAFGAMASFAIPALAAGPRIAITTPSPNSKISGSSIPVTVAVNGFNVECADVGKPGKSGQGHIHAMIDGMTMAQMSNLYCGPTFESSGVGLMRGIHRIAVTLASDDHMDLPKPAMVTFDYEPTQVVPLPAPIHPSKPRVSIVVPKNGATVPRTFDLAVQVNDFNLSCALEGKPNVAGYGHLHVFVAQKGVTDTKTSMPMSHESAMSEKGGSMSAGSMSGAMNENAMGAQDHMMQMMSMVGMLSMPCTRTIPVDLSSWNAGKAHITVMLANDDHNPTMGAQAAAVDVVLQ